MISQQDTVLTVPEVAIFLKVSETTIYRLAKSGKLPARKVGGAWRFSQSAIQEWLHAKSPATKGVHVQ